MGLKQRYPSRGTWMFFYLSCGLLVGSVLTLVSTQDMAKKYLLKNIFNRGFTEDQIIQGTLKIIKEFPIPISDNIFVSEKNLLFEIIKKLGGKAKASFYDIYSNTGTYKFDFRMAAGKAYIYFADLGNIDQLLDLLWNEEIILRSAAEDKLKYLEDSWKRKIFEEWKPDIPDHIRILTVTQYIHDTYWKSIYSRLINSLNNLKTETHLFAKLPKGVEKDVIGIASSKVAAQRTCLYFVNAKSRLMDKFILRIQIEKRSFRFANNSIRAIFFYKKNGTTLFDGYDIIRTGNDQYLMLSAVRK
jgi:hypothetical protein